MEFQFSLMILADCINRLWEQLLFQFISLYGLISSLVDVDWSILLCQSMIGLTSSIQGLALWKDRRSTHLQYCYVTLHLCWDPVNNKHCLWEKCYCDYLSLHPTRIHHSLSCSDPTWLSKCWFSHLLINWFFLLSLQSVYVLCICGF